MGAHGAVDSTYYSQITMVRTIEQILGAQPLNEKLAAATPMYGAFTKKPDYTPFTAVPNQVPLTEGVATAAGLRRGHARHDRRRGDGAATDGGRRRPRCPPSEQATAAAWQTWLAKQHTTGNGARPRLRQPGADEPVHVVPDPRLEGALPG